MNNPHTKATFSSKMLSTMLKTVGSCFFKKHCYINILRESTSKLTTSNFLYKLFFQKGTVDWEKKTHQIFELLILIKYDMKYTSDNIFYHIL